MKVIYTFMIGLILFNFYACTKQQTYDPRGNQGAANSKLEITYLDKNNQATEERTDDILMKLKDDESGLIMVSRKTGKEDGVEEYTTSLIDTAHNTSISMVYTNRSEFPHKILLVNGEETMIGYTSAHRKEAQDFDIIWYSEDGNGESCENIPLKTTIYNHIKTAGFDDETDYQIKTIRISVKIADAINKYVEENPNGSDEYNPLLRGKWWSKFCSVWKKIIAPIVIAIAVIVAIVVPIFIPAATGIVLGVTGGVSGAAAGLAVLFDQIDNSIESSPGEKALLISKNVGEDYYKDGEIIYLKEVNSETAIYFNIINEPIDYLHVKIEIEGDANPYEVANNYFSFNTGEGYSNLNNNYVIKKDGGFSKNTYSTLKIKKKREIPDGYSDTIYLTIQTGNNVMVNRGSSSGLRLILK